MTIILGDEAPQCTYELLHKATNICKFVKENCKEGVESIDLFEMRYCILGGEGEGGAILFFIALVC